MNCHNVITKAQNETKPKHQKQTKHSNTETQKHKTKQTKKQPTQAKLHPRASNLAGPEGAGDTVEDPSSDEERDTTDAETDAETAAEEAWCPPMPDAPDDPTESEIAGAADKLETMLRGSHPSVNILFQPDNLGALPALWLQAKLTISLTSIQDNARLFMTIAAELWLRGLIDTRRQFFRLRPETLLSG